ncbi:MAG: phospholipid carrier-dependent glycosyltransferase [Candidatus Binataceae bacterium]
MNRMTRGHRLALCALVALLLYLPGLGRPALLEPDEGRYAEVAREMVVQDDYITPRDNWVRYFEKPPLIYWANAGAIQLFGVNEFAVRLPTALFSVGQVVAIAALGEAMFGAAAGMLGALALALSPLFFGFARFATPDPALAFFMTAALAAFWTASRCDSFGHGRGRLWMIAAAAMLGFGTLAKGPVALVLAGAIALVYLVAEGRIREALAMPWLWCIVAYLAIALPWFILVAERNPGFLRFFFVHEHVKRYLEDTEHGWGPYFFVIVVAGGMWPWLYFIPLGIKELLRGDGDDERRADSRSALWFLLIWFGLIFIFFSVPRSKLGSYILPGIPPLAVIAGYGLWRLDRIGAARARGIIASLLVVNVILAIAVAIVFAVIHDRLGTALTADGLAMAAAFVAGAGLAYCSVRFGRDRGVIAPGVTAAAIAVGVALAMGALMKAREDAAPMFSYRELARAVTPYLDGNDCMLASYLHHVQSLPFYTRHREALVDYRGELAPFSESLGARASFIPSDAHLRALWQSPQCIVLIANRHDLRHLGQLLTPPGAVIGCEGKKVALISRPPAGPVAAADACAAPIWNSSREPAPGLGFLKGHL